jgi:phosphotransacetylase
MSHLFVVELKTYPKLLVITDAAMHIAPDLMEKAAIIQNAVDVVRLWGIDAPKVACLSAVETVNPAIPSTIDAACLAKMADRGQIRHAIIDGPLAFDNAISQRSSQIKHIVSPVAGDVDIVLTPDLVSGNILVKDLEYLAGATVAGFIAGAQVPIVLTSRADPPRSRLLSLALALLVHHLSQDGDTAS